MAELLPNYLQEACYTAQLDRLLIAGLVCGDGVADVVGGSLAVTSGGSGLDLSIAQGGFFVEGDDDDRGVYHGYNDAAVTLTATAADPTNPRIDQVIARVYDTTYGEGADEWALEVLAGTPTAGATLTNLNGAATLPDNSVRLAYVLVPAAFVGPFVDATHGKDARTEFVSCGAPYMPYVALDAAAPTSVSNGGAVNKLNLATTVHLDDEFFSVAASVVTVLKAGLYDITGSAFFASSGTTYSYWGMGVYKNGLASSVVSFYKDETAIDEIGVTVTRIMVPLAAGDTLQLGALQTSGAARNVDGDMVIRKVG